jgi:hypothetical protein
MSDDAELLAMATIKDALAELDADARERVIWWVTDRYHIALRGIADSIATNGGAGSHGSDDEDLGNDDGSDENGGGVKEYEHFAELYDAAAASTDPERALVAAYWIQVLQQKTPFSSLELNKLLKDLGHGVSSINGAMTANIKKKPALMLQVSRSGSAKQARKKYKLTDAGKKWVDARLT